MQTKRLLILFCSMRPKSMLETFDSFMKRIYPWTALAISRTCAFGGRKIPSCHITILASSKNYGVFFFLRLSDPFFRRLTITEAIYLYILCEFWWYKIREGDPWEACGLRKTVLVYIKRLNVFHFLNENWEFRATARNYYKHTGFLFAGFDQLLFFWWVCVWGGGGAPEIRVVPPKMQKWLPN